jgi:hypothetical protein
MFESPFRKKNMEMVKTISIFWSEWGDSVYYGVAAIELAASKAPPEPCI